MPTADFSLKMRRVKAKLQDKRRLKKFKLKTKKSAQKRLTDMRENTNGRRSSASYGATKKGCAWQQTHVL